MPDDLKVRIVWQNDEASLRAAMAAAQQMLQQVTGNVGYGNVAGVPTPAAVGAAGGIRARDPNVILGPNGQPVGTSTATITAPPPNYTASGGGSGAASQGATITATSGNATSFGAQVGGAAPQQAPQQRGGGIGLKFPTAGYFGRYAVIRQAMATYGAIGEAAQQQQSISDMNRRVGEGIQKWREFETQIMQVGVGLGATRQQMIELTNTFVSSVGKMGTTGQTTSAIRSSMELAKTMGVAPEVVTGFEGRSAQFMQGPSTDFNKLGTTLYMAVQAGMRGREEEVVKAIESLEAMVGQRLPDLGDLSGISALMTTMNGTGVQGLMGARGAQVAGNLDQFLQGKGAPAGNIMLMRALAQTSRANGEPTDIIHLTRAMEGGINNPLMLRTLKTISQQTSSQGPDIQAFLMASMGMGITQNQALKLAPALQSMDIDQLLARQKAGTLPGMEKTEADKNTEAIADLGRATQELGETAIPLLTEVDKALTLEMRGVAGILGGLSSQMKVLGAVLGVVGPALGVSSMLGVSPMSLATGIGSIAGNPAATGLGKAGGALFAGGGGLTALGGAGALGGGLLLGGLGSLLIDKMFHPDEATTLDMMLQMAGVRGLPGQVGHDEGGIVTKPSYILAGENGPEAIIPIAKMLSSRLGGTGDAWKAFANQINIETGGLSQMYGNNPLNLRPIRGGWGGQVGVSPGGFAMFDSIQSGIEAAAQNYMAGNYGYSAVTDAARRGDPSATWSAITASGWDAGHYGMGGMGGGSMAPAQVINHHLTVTVRQPDGSHDKFSVDLNSPYRNVITSPNWGITA